MKKAGVRNKALKSRSNKGVYQAASYGKLFLLTDFVYTRKKALQNFLQRFSLSQK
jgi:hypothetical protein